MGKALMVGARNQAATGFANGDDTSFFGVNGFPTAEANVQIVATEACTISKLHGHIISGGSDAANTFQVRKNGANGNQVASRTGPGAFSDASNTDSLAANDTFNVLLSEASVTDPVLAFLAANVEFSSGHGNFHGSTSSFGNYDTDSSTRYASLAGPTQPVTTEADTQWPIRYTSWEALQVRVQTNARTSTSTIRNRINGADGGFQIDYAAGVTGTVVDTTTPDSLSAGDLVNVSVTLGTGTTEDFVIPFICGTFKSTAGKSQIWTTGGTTRTASATATPHAIGGSLRNAFGSEANNRITPGFPAIVSHLTANISANTYTGDCFVRLLKNGSAVLTLTIGSGVTGMQVNSTDTVVINATDELTLEIDEGTSGSATFESMGITFSPDVTYPKLERGTRGLLRGLAPMWR